MVVLNSMSSLKNLILCHQTFTALPKMFLICELLQEELVEPWVLFIGPELVDS